MRNQIIFIFITFVLATVAPAQRYSFANKPSMIRWSRLDIDVKEAEVYFDSGEYDTALSIYSQGRRARPRTLQKLSSTAGKDMKFTPLYVTFRKYWKSPRYADLAVLNIIRKRGPYVSQSQKFRADAGIKFIQYLSVWMYVVNEMQAAVRLCRTKKPFADAVLEWDRSVADYMGSSIVADESNAGYSLHTLAIKRCGAFGTCTPNGLRAKANNKFYIEMMAGKKALLKRQCAVANRRKNNAIKLMHVPLLQGCVRYIAKTKADTGEDKKKSHGEAWAFCAAVLPSISKCNKAVATIVRNQVNPKVSPAKGNPAFVVKQLYKTFKCMGVKCSDFGALEEFPEYNIPRCSA